MMDSKVSPRVVDTLLSDIGLNELKGVIQDGLDVVYLSPAVPSQQYDRNVCGLLYGILRRAMVNMEVVKGDCCLNVIFLVDPGSGYTYITRDAARALGVRDDADASFLILHGVRVAVQVAPDNAYFKDVNILGTDWMTAAQAVLHINYNDDTNKAVHIESYR